MLAQRFQEGQIGRHPLGFRRRPMEYPRASGMRLRGHLVEQPRLADARLAADQRDGHPPRNGVCEALLKLRHLALPPDER
jgi:hypothetical protein